MVLGGGDSNLFMLVDLDVTGEEDLDMLSQKLKQAGIQSEVLENQFNRTGNSIDNTADSASNAGGEFGKMFGIGMNVLFLGMAMNMVFGRMAKNMLNMTGAMSALGAGIKSMLLPFFIALTPHVLRLAESMMNLPKEVKMVIGGFVALMAILGPILMIVGQLALLFVSGIGLGMIATAVGVAVGALAILYAGFKTGMAIGNRFEKEIRGILTFLGNYFEIIFNSINQTFKGFKQMLKGTIQFFSGVFSGNLQKTMTGLKNIFGGAINQIIGIFKFLTATILAALETLAPQLLDQAQDLGRNIVEGVINGIKSMPSAIKNAFFGVLPAPLAAAVRGVSAFAGDLTSGLQSAISVNDFILTDNGKLLKPDKNDTIIGTKTPGELGGGGNVEVNINDPVMKEDVDVQRVVDEVEDRVNRDTRGRTGLGT